MGQKLVNELFKTLADGQLFWDTIIRPQHKRRKQREPGQKYSDKQTRALAYFACKPKEEKKGKSKGNGKEREQPAAEPIRQTPKPTLFTNTAPSSSAPSKSTRRR